MRARAARRTVLQALLLLAALAGCARDGPPKPPDVVLLVIDTLRAQSLSTYGYERETSPNLSRFAGDAVTYQRAISTGTWTVPTHGAFFTGRLPSFHGAERVAGERILATPLNPELTTLAEILARSGYRTGGFAANATYLTPSLGFARGFDEYVPLDARVDDTTRRALDWFDRQPRPTFLFVNVLDPHEPYEPPPPYDARFPGRRPELGTKITDLYWAGKPLTPEINAHFRSQYDGEIAYTDAVLADFFAGLRRSGRYRDALVVVTSDHGEMLGEHGAAGHGGAPYEELVRVPLLVKLPGNERAGTTVARRVSTLGVFAEILAVAGVAPPPGTQSVRFDQDHRVWIEDVDFTGHRVTVGYDDELKLVHRIQPDGSDASAELYALATDPGESTVQDAARAPALVAEVERFRTLPRPVNAAPPPVVDPERERKLRELGYLH